MGYLAGLVGIGNDSEKYGGGFNGWIAGAADNGLSKWFTNIEDDKIKNDWLPIYQKASEKDHGFFRHAGDLDFWTSDLTDGAAFMASSFVPGMGIAKLKLGANVLEGLSALQGIGRTEEAAALAEEGVQGTVASKSLEQQGLGATLESPETANTIVTKADATQQIPRVIKWINNARLQRSIDVGSTSILNTASQAMYSANDAKNNAYDTLINAKNEDGTSKYTTAQAKQISAKVAKDSYVMNLGALSLMNLWEANFIFKKPSLANAFGKQSISSEGLFGDATLAKKTIGQRIFNASKEAGKGFLTAGVWLGNVQLAVDRLNNNPDNFDLDFGDKLKGVAGQYLKQTSDALQGNDPEAAKSLGVGGFLGAVVGKVLGHNGGEDAKKSLDNLNKQISAFRGLDNIYKTDANGKLELTDGNPVLDENKVKSWVASFNNILSLNQIAKTFDKKGINEMAKLYGDEVFSRFAKAHFDAGLSDLLYQKLNDVGNISKDDLALLGFDPDSKNKGTSELLNDYKKKAESLESLYNNIHENFISPDIPNTKEGQKKRFDIADKMFYLSARSQSLSDIIKSSKESYERIKANTDSYNAAFNSITDQTVNQYNELFEKAYSAGRQPSIHPDLYNSEADYTEINKTRDQSKEDLDEFVKNNKEVLEKLKKDSRGRYLYEIANKNLLPSAKEMEREQIVQAEVGLARNATTNVLSRLADPKFGVKYYDQVYSKELERNASEAGAYSDLLAVPEDQEDQEDQKIRDLYKNPKKDINSLNSDVTEDEINDAYNQAVNENKVDNKKRIVDHIGEKISKGQKLTDQEEVIRQSLSKEIEDNLQKRASASDLNDLSSDISELEKRREVLDNIEDKTTEQETELENINNQIESLNDQKESKFQEFDTKDKVDNSDNIKPEDKTEFNKILNNLNKLRKRVVKFDDHYEVDGENYRKVTDLIGDSIPDYLRNNDPKIQAAVSIGNTIDSMTKAYFANQMNDEFKNSVSGKMSEETYNNIIKSLDKVKADLTKKGIDIVANNVVVTDPTLKVAGEIDLLGVDKNGHFKIYEVQARNNYLTYGKKGLGIKLRDIDGKRLSMYRNMFANQNGVIPDEISVKFPFEVKYDKTNTEGFIDNAKIREPIRFTPLKNIEIKLKNGEPLRLGSKFNSLDMTRIFLNSFLPTKDSQDKLKFVFRNVPLKEMLNTMKMTVRPALPEFQQRFESQRKALAGEPGEYVIKKLKDYRNKDEQGNPREFSNLYTLVGNTEISLSYDGTPAGYLSPVQTLAYKDIDGTFKILDENTDAETYSNVTGNNLESYPEFKNVAIAYKKLHTELTNRMIASPNKEVTLSGDELKKLVDLKPSIGELDLIGAAGKRPDLKDLSFSGVRLGDKSIPTVANIDTNDSVKILMDKGRKNQKLVNKYQEVDKWVNSNLDQVKAAMYDKSGRKVTDNVAIVETPSGEFKIVSLRAKQDFNPAEYDDFVDDLGSKFTSATTKNVFKNENIMVIPKQIEERGKLDLKEHQIISKVYETEDIDSLENFKPSIEKSSIDETDSKIDDFLKNASVELRQDLEDYGLTTREDIKNDIKQGDWPSVDEYINNLKNCK